MRTTTLVGRDADLAVVLASVEAAVSGAGAEVIAITGNAGIGKTRFATELSRIATERGMQVAWGAAWTDDSAPPLWPWPQIEMALSGSPSNPSSHDRFDRFSAVVECVSAAARQQPVMVVIDDAQLLDEQSFALLRFLIASAKREALVVLVTWRSDGDDDAERLRVLGRVSTIRLRGLSGDDIGELLPTTATPEQMHTVQELTDGNPFLIGEVLFAAPDLDETALLNAATTLTAHRLIGFEPQQRLVLTAAAVAGVPLFPAELADLVGQPLDDVVSTLAAAEQGGVIDACAPVHFRHDLLRQAVLAQATDHEMNDIRCRLVFQTAAPHDGAAASRRAHHALGAARAHVLPMADAIEACRFAAQLLTSEGAFEAAVEQLAEAVALATQTAGVAEAALLTAHARAVLACGRLAEARPLFRAAAKRAEEHDEVEVLAEAALGLSGLGVHELRDSAEHSWHLQLLQRTLLRLGPASVLAARVRIRLAAEELYDQAHRNLSDIRRCVDDLRALGDNRALAEGLGLYHHILLHPRFAEERLTLAEEIIRVASEVGDELLSTVGVWWRTTDLYLLGRASADRSLAEAKRRVDSLGVRAFAFMAEANHVMQLQRAGRFVEAAQAADACLRLGVEAGDADAAAYYAGQLLVSKWIQGIDLDALLSAARSLDRDPATLPDSVYPATLAALAAMVGRHDEARAELARVGGGNLRNAVPSSNWSVTMHGVVEAASRLADAAKASEAYALLLPFAKRPQMAAHGIACLGSTERTLGLAARTFGDLDLAIEHLRQAQGENARLGNLPMLAITHFDLATTLWQRGTGDDAEAARSAGNLALTLAGRLGMSERVRQWTDTLVESVGLAPSRDEVASATMRRQSGPWEVSAGKERVIIPDSIGAKYLASLLARPGVEIPVADLAMLHVRDNAPHDMLDSEAQRSYLRRLAELRMEIDDAEQDGNTEQAAARRAELSWLADELERTMRPGGRSRSFVTGVERARTAVQKALRRTLDAIGQDAPELASGLRACVHTGTHCVFRPTAGVPSTWSIDVGVPDS